MFNIVDKITLHKEEGEIIYSNLFQLAVNISKLQADIAKLQNQLMQEKTQNKSLHIQMKELQQKIVNLGSDP